jgi:hypothetical protein
MNEQMDKAEFEMGRSAMKHALSWYGWGSPVGLGVFLVELGVFLWMLHLAGIIH